MRRNHTGLGPSRFTLGFVLTAGLIAALVPAPAVASTTSSSNAATPEPTSTAPADVETREPVAPTATPTPEITESPEAPTGADDQAEQPAPAPSPSPTQSDDPPLLDELTPEQMDQLARDTTLDEAVVEEGADTAIRTKSLAGWNAGNIISDAVFYNSGTMSAGQIQSFLNSKVPRCEPGYVCLKDYRQDTPTRGADQYCPSTYAGAANESAASIIAKAAQACGINPQVLLVMLQKEQGLVTHVWPSDWRYTKAMGMACPDTAACDPRYAGFFHQVYGAARQLKVYGISSGFNWFPVGRTSNIQFNPNAGCGSAPVYIANKATAALYYYTPYQPNQAALNAGYGEGDRCSAYGNRNFYNYFTDWFGSTQAPAARIVQGYGRNEVYLISDGTKHHIRTGDDLETFRSRLGDLVPVAASYVDALPTGSAISRYVHDTRTGTLYLLSPAGTKNRFVSEAQIVTFGYAFPSYVNLEHGLLDRFATGPDVTNLFRSGMSPEVYLLSGSTKRYIMDPRALEYAARGTSGFVASMAPDTAAKLALGPSVIHPKMLVKAKSSGDVHLVLPTGALLHIPSFELAAEFGARTYREVDDWVLERNPILRGDLAPVVSCGGQNFIVEQTKLWAVNSTLGFAVPQLSVEECASFERGSGALSTPIFVQPVGRGEVYALERTTLRHIRSYETLTSMNGSRPLRILPWDAPTADRIGYSAPYLAEGSFVQFTGAGEVYRFASGQLRHVQRYETLLQYGGGRQPAIESLPADWKSWYAVGAPVA